MNSVGKLAARGKRMLAWSMLQRQASAAGLDPRDLQKVDQYLQVSLGLQEPRYTHPLQRPRQYFQGLTAKPWHEPTDFQWTAALEQRHEAIRKELSEIRASGFLQPQPQGLTDAGRWTVYYLYALGRKVEENCRRCPQTTEIIDSLQSLSGAGLAYFSVLTEGTHIKPHCGPTNTRLRCHLGLVVPEGCRMRVGSEARSWEEGRCLVFDDSFEHEVWNVGDGTRMVLVLDVWHPDLTRAEAWALGQIIKMSTAARKYSRSVRKNAKRIADDGPSEMP